MSCHVPAPAREIASPPPGAEMMPGDLGQPPGGWPQALQQKVHGVFTYEVDEQGKVLALRGYWDTADPRNQMVEIDTAEAGKSAL